MSLIKELNESYFLVDICSHLTNRKFNKDLDSVVARSKQSGIQKIIIRSTNVDNSRDALRLSRLYPEFLYLTSGFSPNDSKLWTEEADHQIQQILLNEECVAIGEIGLDFERNICDPKTQLEVFESFLKMAAKIKTKPVLMVIRNGHDQALEILRKYVSEVPYFVIHSFCGSREDCLKYLDLGQNVFIGLSGMICKDKCDVISLLADHSLPLSRIMLESDSPWNLPNIRSARLSDDVKNSLSQRSLGYLNRYCTYSRNEPCSLAIIAEIIANISQQSAHEVALQTTFNALKVFGLTSN